MDEIQEIQEKLEEQTTQAQEPVQEQAESVQEETITKLLFDYIQQIFGSKIENFLDKLSEEQKAYFFAFFEGYKVGCNQTIVGVYEKEYLERFNLPEKLMNKLNLEVKHIVIEDKNMEFSIVTQR